MIEKVKVTKKQAEQIEKLKACAVDGRDTLVKDKAHGEIFNDAYEDLNKLSLEDFIKVLYVPNSYEVEPEFEVKDYVVTNRKKVVEILEFDSENHVFTVGWIANGKMYKEIISKNSVERYATNEEVWWAKHGRGVREYKKGDIVINLSQGSEISRRPFRMDEDFTAKQNHLKLVCAVEDRLDVKTNE